MSEFLVGQTAKLRYREFIRQCQAPHGEYRLTPRAESTPYALAFAIFGLHLLGDRAEIANCRELWNRLLRERLRMFSAARVAAGFTLEHDKPYLQLLTFTLSALCLLGTLDADPLFDEVSVLLPSNLDERLSAAGAVSGKPQSGNHAMFLGILLLHGRDRLGLDTQAQIDRWVQVHFENLNRFGFWGEASSMSHLQFQNGYHQYELLEYLHADRFPWSTAADNVAGLADRAGHFAPYPGGGGCFDYDAVFMLTAVDPLRHRALLRRTASSLLAEQGEDGGFCESQQVRPRGISNMLRTARHIASARGAARRERLRYGLSLQRPKHNRIHTHWSSYSRAWSESNLWDSWFRMLALARIEVGFEPSAADRWGFINYPGIGFHPCARAGARS